MVGDILQPSHLLFVLVVALLVLGPKRLPEVGRALGRTMRDFRSAISGDDSHDHELTAAAPPPPPVAAEPTPALGDEAPTEVAEPHTGDAAETVAKPAREPTPTT